MAILGMDKQMSSCAVAIAISCVVAAIITLLTAWPDNRYVGPTVLPILHTSFPPLGLRLADQTTNKGGAKHRLSVRGEASIDLAGVDVFHC